MRAQRIVLEENINAEVLSDMQRIFAAADVDGDALLDVQEFIDAFLGVLFEKQADRRISSSHVGVLSTEDGADERALQKLFMRVDVNADGVIDWSEFVGYMLLRKKHENTKGDISSGSVFSTVAFATTLPEKLVSKLRIRGLRRIRSLRCIVLLSHRSARYRQRWETFM